MKKTLQGLRVDERTLNNMKRAVEKWDNENVFPMTQAEFRRLAYEVLAHLILNDQPIPVRLQK